MAQSTQRTVDVQFTGDLLPELIKSLKSFTQTAHIVFGQHDLAVIGAEQDDASVGPNSLPNVVCFRLSRHSADHYHVNPISPIKEEVKHGSTSDEEEEEEEEEEQDDEDDEDAALAQSVIVGVDYSALLSCTTGKNYKGAVFRMIIERDDPCALIIILTSRSGDKKTIVDVDPSIYPISMRHDYPPHSARSIVGQKLHNTVINIADHHKNCGITYEKDMIIFRGLVKKSQHSSVRSVADTLNVANTPPEANSFKAQGEFNAKKLSTFTKNFKLGERINMYLNDGLPLVLEILFPNYEAVETAKLTTAAAKKKSAAAAKRSEQLEDKLGALSLQDDNDAKKYEACQECQAHLGVPLADTPSYLGYIRYSLRGVSKLTEHEA